MKNTLDRESARLGKMKGATGVLEGDLKARDARSRQKDNVQVIGKETGWEETNIDMGQLSQLRDTQCGQFLD
jgi:hypothetical protein